MFLTSNQVQSTWYMYIYCRNFFLVQPANIELLTSHPYPENTVSFASVWTLYILSLIKYKVLSCNKIIETVSRTYTMNTYSVLQIPGVRQHNLYYMVRHWMNLSPSWSIFSYILIIIQNRTVYKYCSLVVFAATLVEFTFNYEAESTGCWTWAEYTINAEEHLFALAKQSVALGALQPCGSFSAKRYYTISIILQLRCIFFIHTKCDVTVSIEPYNLLTEPTITHPTIGKLCWSIDKDFVFILRILINQSFVMYGSSIEIT